MARRTISRIRPEARPKTEDDRQGTRRILLEAAGQVFAEKGFEQNRPRGRSASAPAPTRRR
jgi:hypothetical protein